MAKTSLSLFAGFGIEIEYMIVSRDSLDVMPIADYILYDEKLGQLNEIEANELCYSNELASHILELKTNGPITDLITLPEIFNKHINKINNMLAEKNSYLLPTAMHPWMNPAEEFKIWPHEYSDIYESYNKIFNCQGHGWSNVQSTHLNLPFANDEEFAKLHAAIRLVLPLIPIIAASSPIVESGLSGYIDTRLFYYNNNQKKIPIVAGGIIPDHFVSEYEYKSKLLDQIYQAITPYDKSEILQEEWLNSRGAIARFDRNTIEIRLIDTQESPISDFAIISLLVSLLQNLVYNNFASHCDQTSISTKRLKKTYLDAVRFGSNCLINDREYLQIFGCDFSKCTGLELLAKIFTNIQKSNYPIADKFIPILENILKNGNLSERILKRLNGDLSKENIRRTYLELRMILNNNDIFLSN
ncbi:MAG: glutamate--cysteine ligase [Gammaproteobacteria bacterium]|nr:glutamate--cysteine ligase [Gammaproteobacteria bacterium]